MVLQSRATTQTTCTHFPLPPRAPGLLLLRREPPRTHRPSVCFQSAWPLPLGLPLTLLLPFVTSGFPDGNGGSPSSQPVGFPVEDSRTESCLAAFQVSEVAAAWPLSSLPPSLPPCPSFWQSPLEEIISKCPRCPAADAQEGGLAIATAAVLAGAPPAPAGRCGDSAPPPPPAGAPAGSASSVTAVEAAAGRPAPLPPSPALSPHFFSCFLVPQMLLPRKNRSQSLVIKLVPAKLWQVSEQLTDDSSPAPHPNRQTE